MNKAIILSLWVSILIFSCEPSTGSKMNQTNDPSEQAAVIRSVDSQEAKTLLEEDKDLILLDVRTPEEFAEGHLKGAINIDFYATDFQQQLAHLNPHQRYMVYCAVGGRSGKTGQMMEEMGFREVYNVTEGFAELSTKGIPVTEGDKE